MLMAANWTFLASRARALPCIAHDPEVARARLRGQPGITERSAYSTVTGPAEAGYEVKQKNRRRNRYQTRAHLTLPEPGSQERTAGDVLALYPHPRRP
jgi:hypothetical protein